MPRRSEVRTKREPTIPTPETFHSTQSWWKQEERLFSPTQLVPRLLPPPSAGQTGQGSHHHSGGDGRATGGRGPLPATSQGALAVLQEGKRGLQRCSCPPALCTTLAVSAGADNARESSWEERSQIPGQCCWAQQSTSVLLSFSVSSET